MSSFNESAMRLKVSECLKAVSLVLDNNRSASIKSADSVSHRYDDKYLLANHLTNTAIASVVNSLDQIGVHASVLNTLKDWNSRRAVSLKFERKQKCKFIKEIEREEEDPTHTRVDSTMFGRTTVKVITKIKEYIYLIEEEYSLSAHSGVGDNSTEKLPIARGKSHIEAILRTNSAPFAESELDTFDVNISWLLTHLDDTAANASFSIDRAATTCATPRQNRDVSAALTFFSALSSFFNKVSTQLRELHDVQSRFQAATAPKFDIAAITTVGIFNPIVPLFEDHEHEATPAVTPTWEVVTPADAGEHAVVPAGPASAALSSPVVNKFLGEQRRSLTNKCDAVAALFASNFNGVYGPDEAKLMVVLAHLAQVAQFYREGVDFIEHMIRSQLVAAVGKELTARDFAQYMTFHNRKVFKEAFQPKPFSYAVRRSPLHSPEGQIQIETTETTPAEPIYTVSQHAEDAPLMEFALNATTTAKFGGERHLHGWMAHRFSGQALPELKFVAEARQFSSYIVLIGRIASAKLFQPKYGFIVQNKDEFRIPLDLEQIPTAKEFKDAISSLSPEQQRFAKAFRSMQLESTLFGVCVIQIKPQLEKVLKLQADSLTKEIKLTQDLMQLFIKYQIPSDLLSFDDSVRGASDVTAPARLVAVKKHVQAMQEMLASAKDEEVAQATQLLRFAFGGLPPPPPPQEMYDSIAYSSAPPSAPGRGGIPQANVRMRSMAAPAASASSFSAMSMSAPPPPPASCVAPSAPAPAPAPKAAPAPKPQQEQRSPEGERDAVSDGVEGDQVDYTQYPNKLEEMYTHFDPDASLRPTIINPGATWAKRAQAGLLSSPQDSSLDADLQAAEKNAAFDLLDALTRSGALPIEHASLHVIIAATHCFDQSLMDTVVQKNVNPIERVERSTLIMAATLNNVPASALITEGQVQRVATFSPMLFVEEQPNPAIEA